MVLDGISPVVEYMTAATVFSPPYKGMICALPTPVIDSHQV